MSEEEKKIDNLQHQVEIRQQALHFTVIYEEDFIKRMGKRQLEIVRDEILDFILDLRLQIKQLKNNLNINDNE